MRKARRAERSFVCVAERPVACNRNCAVCIARGESPLRLVMLQNLTVPSDISMVEFR